MYCAKCKIVFGAQRCPVCGDKKVAEPSADDVCYLTEADYIWSGMVEDVLAQNRIPFMKRSTIGAGMAMRLGSMFERFRFYVRYDDLDRATAIIDELFNAPQTPEDPPLQDDPS